MSHALDFAALVDCAGDAVIVANQDGALVFWNHAAERIFGYSAAEAVGQSLDLIIPDRFRQRHWEGWRETVDTGRTKYAAEVLRVPAQHKNGRRLSIAFTVTLLPSANGSVDVVAAIVRDETERWNDEQKMRRRLAECTKALADTESNTDTRTTE